MKVVTEKSDGSSCKDGGQERLRLSCSEMIGDGNADGCHGCNSRGEAIHNIDDVEGVRDRDNPKDRQRNCDINRKKRKCDKCSGFYKYERRKNLAQQFLLRS